MLSYIVNVIRFCDQVNFDRGDCGVTVVIWKIWCEVL